MSENFEYRPAKYWEPVPDGHHWVADPSGSDASAGHWEKNEPETPARACARCHLPLTDDGWFSIDCMGWPHVG